MVHTYRSDNKNDALEKGRPRAAMWRVCDIQRINDNLFPRINVLGINFLHSEGNTKDAHAVCESPKFLLAKLASAK